MSKLLCGLVSTGMQKVGSKESDGRGDKFDLSEKGVVLRDGRCWCRAGEAGWGRLDSWGVRLARLLFVGGRVETSAERWSEELTWLRLSLLSCGNSVWSSIGVGSGSGRGADCAVLRVGGR